MASDENTEEKEEGEAKAKKKSKLPLIIIAVVVLLAGGGGAFMFLGGSEPKKEHGEEEAHEEKHYLTLALEPFIVNLRAANTFLKVTLLIEYDPSAVEKSAAHGSGGGGFARGAAGSGGGGGDKPAMPALFTQRLPMMRDAIIRTLSSKTADEVLTPEGKEQLKDELMEVINESLDVEEEVVTGLYFSEFILQ